VELAGGERICASTVVANADPAVTLRLLDGNAESTWRKQVERVPMRGCTVKLSVALNELPNFVARPGVFEAHHMAQINTPLSKEEWRKGFAQARAGELPDKLWTELYFQSVHDQSVAPPGKHVMSVFAQYVPYEFATGDWEMRRDEVGDRAIASIARFCSNLPQAIWAYETMGPPDI
jgi:phytoene dehydrogenase-like protein